MQAGQWIEAQPEVPGMLVRRGLHWAELRHWKVSLHSSVDSRSQAVAAASAGAERRACGTEQK